MRLNRKLESITLLMGLALLVGCPGQMTVLAVDPGDDDDTIPSDDDDSIPTDDDDDITPSDDDDITPGDDDDTAPGDDDDSVPGDDDDATAPAPGPIADCGPFVVPPGNTNGRSDHYAGEVLAHRPAPGENRVWTGCEVRRYFNDSQQYQCQIYWSINGERVEWDDPCSIYIVDATYVPEYSDCSPGELGGDAEFLDDFEWSYGTEYHWPQTQLSLWSASGAHDEVPGGPSGGECGFNGPQGNDWARWGQNIPFQNWGGSDSWEYLEFQYATDF